MCFNSTPVTDEQLADRNSNMQEVTVSKLQDLYDDLREVYPPAVRPSGLTIIDSVGGRGGGRQSGSWYSGLSSFLHVSSEHRM